MGDGGCGKGGWSISVGRSLVLISDNVLELYQLEPERVAKETERLQPPLRGICIRVWKGWHEASRGPYGGTGKGCALSSWMLCGWRHTCTNLALCLFMSVEQRCRDERHTGDTGFSTRLAEFVRLEGKVSEKQPHSQIPASVFNWGATGWMKTGSRAFLCWCTRASGWLDCIL